MGRLSVRDYRGVLDVLHLAGENETLDPFPEHVLERMRELVPCNFVAYGDHDPNRRGWRKAPVWVGDGPRPNDSIIAAYQALRKQAPDLLTGSPCVLRWSDRVPRRALRRLELYWEVLHPMGQEYALSIWLADREGAIGKLDFDRTDRDFSARDVELLETLLPHFVPLARRAGARWSCSAGILTAREREIVAWLARGKQNTEIAKRLYISPGTVRKHLDNIYMKLDAPNRTAAVSRAYGLG